MTNNCGEAGCADGCCGSAECLPSAKGKLGGGSPSIRVEARRVIEAWESSPLRSNDGMLFERIEDLRAALGDSLLAKEAECEALRADAARLDWMDRNPGRIKHSTGYRGDPDSWIYTDDCGYGLDAANLRAAIDAARAAADQGGAS